MSYCRFSSDNFRSDVYVYEDCLGGWTTHVAGNKPRFGLPDSPGSSWVHVPDSHVSVGDDRERCAACTKKHGPAQAMPGYVKHLVQGVVPDA